MDDAPHHPEPEAEEQAMAPLAAIKVVDRLRPVSEAHVHMLIDFQALDRGADSSFATGAERDIDETAGFGVVPAELADMTGY